MSTRGLFTSTATRATAFSSGAGSVTGVKCLTICPNWLRTIPLLDEVALEQPRLDLWRDEESGLANHCSSFAAGVCGALDALIVVTRVRSSTLIDPRLVR